MTHSPRKKDAKRIGKAVLREMKKLSKIIAKHAGRHKQLLEKSWRETDLTEGDMRQIVSRIEGVLEKLPAAIKQAHERIIGERQVENEERILSLYEDHAAVYVRGEAGAEVGFGSPLLLGECASGVIVDWELVSGDPQADAKMLKRSNALSSSCAIGLDEGDGGGNGDQRGGRGPGIRQQGEPGCIGREQGVQRELPEGAGGSEEADEGRAVCEVAAEAVANGGADRGVQERIPREPAADQGASE